MSTSEAKKAYHHGNLRATLIELGLAALEESPESDLSLRELARQAGVSPNAVYRHFADKDALLTALAAQGFRLFAAEADAADLGIDPSDARKLMEAYGIAYVRSARRRPALFKLMFGLFSASAKSEELTAQSTLLFDRLLARVARFSGLDERDPALETAALYAWSIVHGLSNLALDGRIDGDIETAVTRVLAFSTRSVNNGS